MKIRTFLGFVFVLFTMAIVMGCGRNEEPKVATRVAAKVNSEEISVHQVNNILARSQNVAPDASSKAKREILDRLIDRQLAKQRAVDIGLDRSPDIVQAIDAARSEILARAYLEQIARAQPRPTTEDVRRYYREHPELFANRRIFNLEEIQILRREGISIELQRQMVQARSMQDITAWLKSHDVKFTGNRTVHPAEQIPLELLPKLQSMDDGAIGVVETGGRLAVLHMIAFQSAPVDEEKATPRIRQFLINQHSNEAIARDMKQLREKAKIEYLGEFENEKATTQSKPANRAGLPLSAQLLTPNNEKGVRSQ